MKIGIISPAAGTLGLFPNRMARGLQWLRRRNCEAALGEHACECAGYVSADVRSRVADINQFLADDSKLILAAIGGYNSSQLLPFLDYDWIHRTGKTFCGYSDITSLLLAIAVRSDVPCIYGPTFLPEICEYPEPYPDTIACLRKLLAGGRVDYTPPAETTAEFIDWSDEEKGILRPKAMRKNDPWTIVRRGTADGPIWGGNFQTLLWIIGTKYFPLSVLDGSILFLEDIEKNPAVWDAMLQSLKLRGVFDIVNGIIMGRYPNKETAATVERLLPQLADRPSLPILSGVDIGHVSPMLSIRLGARTHLELQDAILWYSESGGIL